MESETANDIGLLLNMFQRNIQRIIKGLKDKGVLLRKGPDKGGHWEIIE